MAKRQGESAVWPGAAASTQQELLKQEIPITLEQVYPCHSMCVGGSEDSLGGSKNTPLGYETELCEGILLEMVRVCGGG